MYRRNQNTAGAFTVQPVHTNLVQLCEQSIATQRAMTGRDIVTHLPSAPSPSWQTPIAATSGWTPLAQRRPLLASEQPY